jgi:hypothetical protein
MSRGVREVRSRDNKIADGDFVDWDPRTHKGC